MRMFTILLAAVSFTTFAADWPQWRGPNRDGISRETIKPWPSEGPAPLWNKANIGIGWSSLAVADGHVYTMGNVREVDHVWCFDAKTGNELWNHSYPCSSKDPNGFPGPRMTPTVDGDRIYTVSRQGHLFCLRARDGSVVWSKEYQKDFTPKMPEWGWAGSPLVEGALLIAEVGGPDSAVVAFDKLSGNVVWKSGEGLAGYASPVAYTQNGQRYVLTFSAYGLESRRVADGKINWRHPWKTNYDVNAATPVVVGEKVFLGSAYGVGGAVLDFSSGQPKVVWQHKKMRTHMGGPVYWKGHLYGYDENDLVCADFETGDVKWSTPKFGKGSLIIADGAIVAYGVKAQLGLIEATPDSYKELAFTQPIGGKDTWAPPALANGILYLRSAERLVALDVGSKQTTSAGNEWQSLFPEDGVPKSWNVTEWSDVAKPAAEGVQWKVIHGVLHGSEPRGTWLMSEKEYRDFELEFEWKIGPRGNSGCGLRFPAAGDPAFDGLELQMCDPRYYPDDLRPSIPPSELTGGLYRAIAPTKNTFKPEDWNKYHVKLQGDHVIVHLNGEKIQDVKLSDFNQVIKRHNGQDAVAMKDRPRKGHIGFQELSRGGGHVEIRNARIKTLN